VSPPVKVALDIHALQVQGFADRGIGRYVAAYAAALARAGRVAAVLLAPELPPPAGLPDELVEADLVRWDSVTAARRLLADGDRLGYRLAYQVTAPFLHTGPADPAALALSPHWAETGTPRVVTLYDLIPLRAPRHYLASPAHQVRYRTRAAWVGTADLVLAISEHSRREAIELLGCASERVVTVGAGVSPFFCGPDGADDELWRYHFEVLSGRRYVLTVGGSDARKGTEQLIAAIGLLAVRDRDLHLLVVGALTREWRRRLAEAASAAGVGDRLVLAGWLSDELLRAAYRRATVTVMPSLAEGSGLPVLESAACGTPAVASWSTSLREVSASPLAGFDPMDVDSLASAIVRICCDERSRQEVLDAQQKMAAASTWEAVAGRAAAALDRLGETAPSGSWVPSPPRRKIAVAGPIPGDGGIGSYNRRLLAGMPADLEVDTVVTGPVVADLPPGVGLVAAAAFGADVRPCSYDAVVYTLGNSAGHLATVALALRHPGWLWLHEVRLPAVATTALGGLDDEQFAAKLASLLERAYPGRPPLEAARRAGRSNLDLIDAGVGLVAPLAERCRGLLVNSNLARRLLLLDLAPLAHHPPIHVLPPGCPPVRRRSAGSVSGPVDSLVVAFGVVSMSKRPDLLIDAVARIGCRLAFVGPCLPILAQVIADRAETRGAGDRVEVVGPVDDDGWRAWMDRATVAVQLRESTNGEISAAVLEALAFGVPVLTSIASAREWPDGTVNLLPSHEPADMASRLDDLLAAPGEQRRLSEAGQAFATAHQFDRLARTLVSIVMQEPAR
jgi:glycosyltransferase involved in cell wall biosynthesis